MTHYLYGRPVRVGAGHHHHGGGGWHFGGYSDPYAWTPLAPAPCSPGYVRTNDGACVPIQARVAGVVVTPGQVQSRKVALDAGWSQLALDITLATPSVPAVAITAPDGIAFDADLAGWKVFLQTEANVLNAGTQDDQTSAWQDKLASWQDRAKKLGVALHGVPVPRPPKPWDPSSLLWPAAGIAAILAAGQIFGGAFRK